MPHTDRNPRTLLPALAAALCLSSAGCSQFPHRANANAAENQSMIQVHHSIDYIEFSVLDLAEAKRFYGAAFQWTFQDYGPDYAGIQRPGGGEVGGLREGQKVERGGPLVVLFSTDLEASVKSVEDAGGRLVKGPYAFPGGRRFHFLDPSGNELAVYSVD